MIDVLLRCGEVIQVDSAIGAIFILRQGVPTASRPSARSVSAVDSLKRLRVLDSVTRRPVVSVNGLVSIADLLVSIL
jgi:hypothetical protein